MNLFERVVWFICRMFCEIYCFRPIFITWKWCFFTFSCQLSRQNDRRTVLTVKFFNHQFIANLPQNSTQIVRYLKYVQNLGFFDLKSWVFRKKVFFFKIAKGGKIAVECVSTNIIS